MKITKAQGKACLEAMERIAEGGRVELGAGLGHNEVDALRAIGWCAERACFDYCGDGWAYNRSQVLMALAWCVTLSGVKVP